MAQKTERFGKYMLLEKLNAGGMAEVYLSRSYGADGVGKFVAIKRILPQYSDHPEFIEMFKEEARLAVNLRHRNIVSIIDFGFEKKQFYLVMDYVEGKNLREIINAMHKQNKGFSVPQVLYIIKEVAAGLDYAHRCIDPSTGNKLNIIHRDISPQNIMLNYEGEIKIVDFGIAKAEAGLENTKSGVLKGKFGYMSPEQAEGSANVDQRTDVFSLGIVMWELLTRDRLFSAKNEANALKKIQECSIPSVRKINPNVHFELEKIVNKALSKEKNTRYDSAASLYKDLNKYLNSNYPDFSNVELAEFLQMIYSKEIIELREKIKKFTQVSLADDEPKNPLASLDQVNDASVVKKPVDGKINELELLNVIESTDAKSSVQDVKPEKVNTKHGQGLTYHPKKKPHFYRSSDPIQRPYDTMGYSIITTYKDRSALLSWNTALVLLVLIGVGVLSYRNKEKIADYMVENKYHEKVGDARLKNYILSLSTIKSTSKNPSAGGQENLSSTASTTSTTPTATSVITTPMTIPVKGTKGSASIGESVLHVKSTPSGAQIFVNGKSTGFSTPGRIRIPTNAKVNVVVKKESFFDYSKVVVGGVDTDLNLTMQPSKPGYLDIKVINGGVSPIVYVNETRLAEKPPITQYPVPSGSKVRIRVENPLSKTYGVWEGDVVSDQRKPVTVILDRPLKR